MKRMLLILSMLLTFAFVGNSQIPSTITIDSTTLGLTKEGAMLLNYQLSGRTLPEYKMPSEISLSQVYQTPDDGVYYGVGNTNNIYEPGGITTKERSDAAANGGVVKKNGSYVWGLTEQDGKIYWGTNNNFLCSILGTYGVTGLTPYENDCWVCEGKYGIHGDELGENGDLIRPRVYCYDPKTGGVEDLTPSDTATAIVEGSSNCVGFRSAGALNGVVFLAGPDNVYGSTVYAYSTKENKFLGMSHFTSVTNDPDFRITNLRRWMVQDNVLYCGVEYTKKTNGVSTKGGALLRWVGDETSPFKFDIVGYAPNELAEIVYHRGRIYAGTWPALANGQSSVIYASDSIPEGGFAKNKMATFTKV